MNSNEPLDVQTLTKIAARKAWEEFNGDSVSTDIPPSFYRAVAIVIKEAYGNLDKMIGKTIKQRLESLYNK